MDWVQIYTIGFLIYNHRLLIKLLDFEEFLKKEIVNKTKAVEGIKKAKEAGLWGMLFWITIFVALTIKYALLLPFIGRIFGWW